MSTKIYNGCRAPRNLDLMDLANTVRETLTPIRYRLEAQKIAEVVAELIDGDASGVHPLRDDERGSPLFRACQKWSADQSQHGTGSVFNDPFSFEMQIIANGDHYYLLPFFQEDEYLDALTSIDGIEHYPYWNNTEEPKGMTWEQWKVRGKEWDAVPGVGWDVPAMHGLQFNLGLRNSSISLLRDKKELILDNQPSIKKRANELLYDVVPKLRPFKNSDRGMMGHANYVIDLSKKASKTDGLISGITPLTMDMLLGEEAHPPITIDMELLTRTIDALDATGDID